MYLLNKITGLLPSKAQPYAKSLFPAVGTLVAVGGTWATTGALDTEVIRTALVGGFASLLTFALPNKETA